MVDAAMYDAVNGLAGKGHSHSSAIVPPKGNSSGDAEVAAAAAAHDVLVALYPDHTSSYDAQLATDISNADSARQAEKGRAWGQQVASGVLAARSNDGISGSETQTLPYAVGQWEGTWGSQPRHLAPFAVADPYSYVDGGPPTLDSAEYAAGYDAVKYYGDLNNPIAGATETYNFWALGGKTDQPAGAWLQIAQTVSADRGLSLADTARLFALESMAMADTVPATYQTKWVYTHWRPQVAIQHGDDDPNGATQGVPTWTARAKQVGSSPQHYSGHSTFSAAGATVLAGFFCTDNLTFSLDTDDVGTGPRTYGSFSQAATEAGWSRVLGGQHFPFSNEAGLSAGRAIGNEVLSTALLSAHHSEERRGCRR
jgi:hypothetical protein